MALQRKNALGRGLDALLAPSEVRTEGSSSIDEIELIHIHPNPDQPRREFVQEALEELANSIKEVGIIQPITLRKIAEDSYQIIAGERRYRASLLAGKKSIPSYIKSAEDEDVMEMALIENIQREDLNALEIALAYQRLLEQYNLTQERLSERVGKKRATIANYLRLLKLPATIQVALQNKEIDMGHARALINMEDPKLQLLLYKQTIEEGYSVRKVEEMVKAYNSGEVEVSQSVKKGESKPKPSAEFAILQEHLSKFFSSKVQFTCNPKGKGKIAIPFENEDELEKIMGLFDSLQK